MYELTSAGLRSGWMYTGTSPSYATRLSNGIDTLVVEPDLRAVLAVDHASPPAVQWRVDFPPGTVPVHAAELPPGNALGGGNILVCDRSGRVVSVRTADGFVTWEYVPVASGWPVHAEYLANGNVLVTFSVNRTKLDDEGVIEGNVVREVRPDGATVWQYGTNGSMGNAANQLAEPAGAERMPDGTTVITDSGNDRIIRVNPAGSIVWQYGPTSLLGIPDWGISAPGAAIVLGDGSIAIADTNNDRIIALGRALSGTASSGQIDCGLPGARKRFSSIVASVETTGGTSHTVSYSIDGGAWKTLSGTALPANTYGKLVSYRVTLSTSRRDLTPHLLGVSIGYAAAPSQPSSAPGNSSGTGTSRRSTGRGTGTGTGLGTGTNGVKRGGSAFSSLGTVDAGEGLDGALTTQRGWSMAQVGSTAIIGGPPGSAGAPLPSLGGLILLGALYGVGALSVPLGNVLARLLGRTPIAV